MRCTYVHGRLSEGRKKKTFNRREKSRGAEQLDITVDLKAIVVLQDDRRHDLGLRLR